TNRSRSSRGDLSCQAEHLRARVNDNTPSRPCKSQDLLWLSVAAKERVSEAFTLLNTYSAHDSLLRDLKLNSFVGPDVPNCWERLTMPWLSLDNATTLLDHDLNKAREALERGISKSWLMRQNGVPQPATD